MKFILAALILHKDIYKGVCIFSGISLIRNLICSPKEYNNASFASVTQYIRIDYLRPKTM